MQAELESEPGTYVLWLRLDRDTRVRVGRLGVLPFAAGTYAYVGSALGPGGVRARLGRHFTRHKSRRWHIDYLRSVSRVAGAWVSYGTRRCEHHWAVALSEIPGAQLPAAGFGASDCGCRTHLIRFAKQPLFQAFFAKTACRGGRLAEIHQNCD